MRQKLLRLYGITVWDLRPLLSCCWGYSLGLFQWFVAPEGRKVGSLKRRVRTQLARWEMKNCTPLWREAHFQVKMHKTHQLRTTFGSWDVEKVHAVVARSTFPSQNVQNTPASDYFWKLRCRKSARRCGAKYISKSKCTKHLSVGPLLEVEMSKKCTPLWREARFEVKMLKTPGFRTTFGRWDVARGRCKGLWILSKVSKTWGFCSIFNYNHHYTTLHSNTLHYTTLHYTPLHSITFKYFLLHYTALCYTALHYTTFHYTTLHYTTLHYATLRLHYTTTTLHYTTLHSITLHYTTLHYISLHYTTLTTTTATTTSTTTTTTTTILRLHYATLHLHYATLHYTNYTTLHSTTLHWITLHYTYNCNCNYTTLHYTTLRYTTFHYTTLH